MQVTNSATIVDYFPEAFVAEADDIKGMKVVVKRFIRRVIFRATGQKSYSTIGQIEAKYDWQCRINKGATVTGFNTDKMPRAEYMPLMCWFMSLIKNYLYIQMTETTDNIIDRDELQQNLIDRIVDDMDLKTLMQLVAEQLDHNYDDYTVDQLIAEVEEYYPDLLEQE